MATQKHLLTKRARIVRDIAAVRVAAASLSKLLAEDVLVGDAWERAVTVLARCRAERTRLAKELRTIDSAMGLIQLVTASAANKWAIES
jgi:Trm5-related predicted tRNA methylase